LSSSREEDDFFEEASSLIYNQLSEEDKIQLHTELADEETPDIKELEPKIRFFRLLNFIEVRYVRVEDWTKKTFDSLEYINSKSQNLPIEDLVFKDANNEDVSFRSLLSRLETLKPRKSFEVLLVQLGLQEEFRKYLDSPKVEWSEW